MEAPLINQESRPASPHRITARPVEILWDASLPVFAKEEFLRAVGDEFGWLGGFDEAGGQRCFLPYTILRKAGLRLVRFRCETIPCIGDLELNEERSFLNSVVEYFRSVRADVIIPGSNNAIFRTYPDGAEAVPYGSYVIDLRQTEETLWKNIAKNTRGDIDAARNDGILIGEGLKFLKPAYERIRETFRRSNLGFMSRSDFERYVVGLGHNGKLLVANCQGIGHSYCLFSFSHPSAYYIYAGNVERQHRGANKLLLWEAIRLFRNLGVRKFDFFGARINPKPGSKQQNINLMKKRFGATLAQGYMWKYGLRPWRSSVYSLGIRVLRGGDMVDQETQRLVNPTPGANAVQC